MFYILLRLLLPDEFPHEDSKAVMYILWLVTTGNEGARWLHVLRSECSNRGIHNYNLGTLQTALCQLITTTVNQWIRGTVSLALIAGLVTRVDGWMVRP